MPKHFGAMELITNVSVPTDLLSDDDTRFLLRLVLQTLTAAKYWYCTSVNGMDLTARHCSCQSEIRKKTHKTKR